MWRHFSLDFKQVYFSSLDHSAEIKGILSWQKFRECNVFTNVEKIYKTWSHSVEMT